MAVPTEAQKADIYFFCGWPQRYVQTNTALEQGIDALSQRDGQWALVVNSISASPPGLLAQLRQLYDVTIPGAYIRLMAVKVGSIELDAVKEIRELRNQGRRLVGALCAMLGILRDADIFAPGAGSHAAAAMSPLVPHGPVSGNYIGK